MSQTTVTSVSSPPQGVQIAEGAGTLTSVSIPMPVASNPGNAIPAVGGGPLFSGSFTGSAPIDISFYDSAAGSLGNPGTLIATVTASNGYPPCNPNAAYTHGLYAVQRSSSSISITHTP